MNKIRRAMTYKLADYVMREELNDFKDVIWHELHAQKKGYRKFDWKFIRDNHAYYWALRSHFLLKKANRLAEEILEQIKKDIETEETKNLIARSKNSEKV